ncbi:hypothetical protein C5167_029539 [Papaver somniferum]|nr:hypothetical protein C5167_029539 [Papaver somniferum]
MLVFIPTACIMAGIALSGAFDVFTCSGKFQLPGLVGDSDVTVILVFLFLACAHCWSHVVFTTHHLMVPGNRIEVKTGRAHASQ